MAQTKVLASQLSNPYKARATKSADQNINDATWTPITFNVENYDPNNNFASNVYTVPITGYYRISFTTTISSNAGKGVSYQVQMTKNSVTFWLAIHQPYPATTTYTSANFAYSDLVYLTAGDVMGFQAYVDTVDSSTTAVRTGDGTFCAFEYAGT